MKGPNNFLGRNNHCCENPCSIQSLKDFLSTNKHCCENPCGIQSSVLVPCGPDDLRGAAVVRQGVFGSQNLFYNI